MLYNYQINYRQEQTQNRGIGKSYIIQLHEYLTYIVPHTELYNILTIWGDEFSMLYNYQN